MNYLVIGRDGKDALERRLSQRDAHLEGVKKLKAENKILYAVAMIEDSKMVGSIMVFDFDTHEEFEHWKANEPYIIGKVWDSVEVMECAVPPLFK